MPVASALEPSALDRSAPDPSALVPSVLVPSADIPSVPSLLEPSAFEPPSEPWVSSLPQRQQPMASASACNLLCRAMVSPLFRPE
jgi:hypothetical protein